MKRYLPIYKMLLLCSVFATCISFCQKQKQHATSPAKVYTGSTPGGAYIKSLLKIPEGTTCEFIKWSLYIPSPSDSFRVTVLYGESQPNTNGFKNGGVAMELTGSYTLRTGNNKIIWELHSKSLATPIRLLQLDDNLLYFLDAKDNLLIGNGGFSYLLNKKNNE